MSNSNLYLKDIPAILIIIVFTLLFLKRKFRPMTTITVLVFAIVGYAGFSSRLFFIFFICLLGMGVIKKLTHGNKTKKELHSYSPANFFYSGASPILAGLIAYHLIGSSLLELSAAVAIGTVFSDTVSSDIGTRVGGRTFLITNFKNVPAGTDGGISFFGSIAGIVSSVLFSVVIVLMFSMRTFSFGIFIAVLIFSGNLVDSFLGATLQKKKIISNEQVNFISVTAILLLAYFCVA